MSKLSPKSESLLKAFDEAATKIGFLDHCGGSEEKDYAEGRYIAAKSKLSARIAKLEKRLKSLSSKK
jgi:hypothetical protein